MRVGVECSALNVLSLRLSLRRDERLVRCARAVPPLAVGDSAGDGGTSYSMRVRLLRVANGGGGVTVAATASGVDACSARVACLLGWAGGGDGALSVGGEGCKLQAHGSEHVGAARLTESTYASRSGMLLLSHSLDASCDARDRESGRYRLCGILSVSYTHLTLPTTPYV